MSARPGAAIVGAGALGLGFLAERMAGDYDLCLADLPGRLPFLEDLAGRGGFAVNVCGPKGMEVREVRGSFSACALAEAREEGLLGHAIDGADILLTAVGARALPGVIKSIAPLLNARRRPAWLLYCENGRNVAARHSGMLSGPVTPVDTVMSRMCRFAGPEETGYAPLWPGSAQSLVVEACAELPLDRDLCRGGPFTPVFQMVSSAEFRLWEDMKLFMHNGLHAFVSYHAYLEGARRFTEVPGPIRAEAERVMRAEIVPAILFHHPHARRKSVEDYGVSLLERFANPWFNDSIERGVRGAAEKLAPDERLLGGRDYIREAGIEPRGYATTIEAAQRIAALQAGSGAVHG